MNKQIDQQEKKKQVIKKNTKNL